MVSNTTKNRVKKCVWRGKANSMCLVAGGGGLRTSTTGGTMGAPQLKSGLPSCIASCLPPDLHHLIYTHPVPGPNDGLESQLNKVNIIVICLLLNGINIE